MHKVIEFFKKVPNTYYNWKKRNEQLSEFLVNSEKNGSQITHIDAIVTNLASDMQQVKTQVNTLEDNIKQINGRLGVIGKGTKMELFDTLHNQRMFLVVNKRWASAAEKKEVKDIWQVYHEELGGNGQGQHYYEEIMVLPESEEELRKKEEK